MRRFFLFIFLIVMCISCQKEPSCDYDFPLSQTDAVKVVKSITNKYQDRDLFISKEIIRSASVLKYSELGGPSESYSTLTSPGFDAWLIVIGPDRNVNGPCEQIHLFVNVSNAKYEQIRVEGRVIVEWDESYYTYKSTSTNSESRATKSSQESIPLSLSSSGTQRWAVIISGGYNASNNYARYWHDCQNIYLTLTNSYNFDESHIFCIVSDGTSSGYDRNIGGGIYDSSPLDFDNDGDNDIQYAATKANISTVFSMLGNYVSAGDEVLVFVTDHGSSDGRIYLWGGQMLSPSELNTELNKINNSAKIDIVLGQCYSGAFITPLAANNRTIATACSSSEVSYGNGNLYDYFLYYWTMAFSSSILQADSNSNGIVSFAEAFNYSKRYEPKAADGSEHPQYSSTPSTFGSNHDICGHELSLSGGDYVSTQSNSTYTISGIPSTISTTWSLSNNLSRVSSNNTSITVTGHVTSGYVSPTATITGSFTLDGQPYTIKKKITSVWRPGSYSYMGYITGSNGTYMITQYPEAYNYYWFTNNPAWQILSQGSFQVLVNEGSTTSPVDLTVGFFDPLGGTIVITDRVKN